MLIMLGNRLINLDHVRDIEPISEEELPPGHGPEVRVTFDDGETYDAGCDQPDLHDVRGLCGVIVPAPPGLVMVEQVPDFDSEGRTGVAYVSSPILAFRLVGSGAPVPVAVKGDFWPSNPVAVLYPDGTCESDGLKFASLEAWQSGFNSPVQSAVSADEIEGEAPLQPAPKPFRH
jgi:hypothetical protein